MARFGSDLEREIQGIRPPSFDMGDLQDRRRRRARRRRVEGGIVALAVAAAGTLVVLRAVPSDVNPAVPVRPHVVAAYPAGDRPSGVAFADGSVWVGHRTLAEVWRIDPATGRVQARIPTAAGAPTLLAADGSTVWAVSPSGRGSTLLRIDPAGATVVASHPVKVIVDAIAAADGRVWLASRTGDAVLVLDAEGRRLARVDVAGGPSAVALDANGAWVVSGLTGDVTRIAVPGFRARPAGHVDGRPTGAAVCGRALWVSTGDGALARLDPRTGGVRSTEQGRFLTAVAADGAVVWAVDGSGGGATAVDCATGKTLGTVRGGKEPTAVTAAAGHAYIADTGGGLVTEVAT